ncbi:MAG TPA: ABC transporter permease [Dermatophilaceae bacterium]|nr:ABC transporter permease [Dermatophilaceae bacterium]
MTTQIPTRTTRITPRTGSRSARRIACLARAEALLLRRNPIALLTAAAMPVAMVLFVRLYQPDGAGGGLGAQVVTTLTAFTLILVVYYNLVTALVARREELVLKRLRTGETSDAEILAGTAVPAVALAWGQILIGILAAVTVLGLGIPANPALVLVAVVLGTAVFVLLAAVSTALTRTVEMAQVTTAPVLFVPLILSGAMIPLTSLPDPLQRLAQVMPLTPVVDLVRLGLTGTTSDGASVDLAGSFGPAVVPVLILTAWVAAGTWATRRWFRWEPRH